MTAHPLLDSPAAWSRLGASLIVATVGSVGMWVIVVVLPAVQSDFGIARGAASVPFTLTMLGFALGNLVMGRAVDRYGIATVLAGSAAMISAGFALAAATPTVVLLALAQFFVGLGTAASFGPLIADVSHWFERRRGIAVAVAASGNYVSGAIWPLLLSGVLASHGWRTVYLLLALIVPLTVIPLALFLLRRRLPEAAKAGAAAAAAARSVASGLSPRALVVLLVIAGLACCVAMSMPQVHIVAYCVDLGYGPAVGAEMLSLMLAGGIVSRILSGFVADRLGGLRTLLIGSGLQGLALFLYLPWDGLVPLYVVSLIFGLAQGGIVPAYALIVREYLPPRIAGERVGLVIMATILGMALGGWMSGWIYDLTGSYRLAFLNGIAWNALNFGIALMILVRSRPARTPVPAAG
ncbi:MAG: MFS transporter [Gemmobacter sp.]